MNFLATNSPRPFKLFWYMPSEPVIEFASCENIKIEHPLSNALSSFIVISQSNPFLARIFFASCTSLSTISLGMCEQVHNSLADVVLLPRSDIGFMFLQGCIWVSTSPPPFG